MNWQEDRKFFWDAVAETRTAPFPGLEAKAGPYYPELRAHLANVAAQVQAVGPSYTPACLVPTPYQDKSVQNQMSMAPHRHKLALLAIRYDHLNALREIGANQYHEATIPDDMMLDETPFAAQRDDYMMNAADKACMNACFRMVFEAVTGHKPSEAAIVHALSHTFGTSTVVDNTYWKILATDTYKRNYTQRFRVVDMIGASLQKIAQISLIAKQAEPDARTFAVLSLQTEMSQLVKTFPDDDRDEPRGEIHANVLLRTEPEGLVVHDPSIYRGSSRRRLDYLEFHRRWAAGLNRAHVVIAGPTP